MFIPLNNILETLTPTIETGLGSDLPTNITSSDFSLTYQSSSSTFTTSFTANRVLSYVGIAANGIEGSTVSIIANGSITLGTVTLSRSNILMFVFSARVVSTLQVVITGGGRPIVSNIAAGDARQIPQGGVNSGYSRNWLNRSMVSRTITNSIGAPIATLVKRMPLKANLSLPNMPNDFIYNEWQSFSDFASTGSVFYITEQEELGSNQPEQSYACFSPRFNAPTAHAQTRELQNLTFGFSCYNGI